MNNTNYYVKYISLVVILLIASGLRLMNTGLETYSHDEAVHTIKALKIVQDGELGLLGPPMPYFSFRGSHGPVSIYLYSLPLLIKADPRLARMFTGFMHVIAVSLIYVIGGKFYSKRVGIISAILFSVHPEAVFMARGIWNPALQLTFALLYLWTGLRGYCEQDKLSRILHLPILMLGVQCHPGIFLLFPITVILFMNSLYNKPNDRRNLFMHTGASCVVAFVTIVPWGLGLYLDNLNTGLNVDNSSNAGFLLLDFAHASNILHQVGTRMYQQLGNWEVGWTQPIQPIITCFGVVFFIFRSLFHRTKLIEGLVAFGYILPPLMLIILSVSYEDHFIWSSFGFAFILQGILLGHWLPEEYIKFQDKYRVGLLDTLNLTLKHLGVLFFGLLLVTQVFFNLRYDLGLGRVSLDNQIKALDLAQSRAVQSDRDLLIVASDNNFQWEALTSTRDARVVWEERSMPISKTGSILLGSSDDPSWDNLYDSKLIVNNKFYIAESLLADDFMLDLVPKKPIYLSNGSVFLGFISEETSRFPTAGAVWSLFLVERVDHMLDYDHKIFVHLIDSDGKKYGQVDLQSVPTSHRRVGEYILHKVDLNVSDNLTLDLPLLLHLGVYYDETEDIHYGNSFENTREIGVRASLDAIVYSDYIDLLHVNLLDTIMQGQPVSIKTNWEIVNTISGRITLVFDLIHENGDIVFSSDHEFSEDNFSVLPKGLVINNQHFLRLPTDIMPGNYFVHINLVDHNQSVALIEYMHPIKILARNRNYVIPETQHIISANYSDNIGLLGYDFINNGLDIELTLYWQAYKSMEIDYKHFVHIWKNDQLVGQLDTIPIDNVYTTSWWGLNEILNEHMELSVPSEGEYTFTVGFYDPITQERLAVWMGEDSGDLKEWVELTTVLIP